MIPWKTTLKRLQEVKELLKLIQIELLKLRRRKIVWLMLCVSLLMPAMILVYTKALNKNNVEPALFFKWSAFGFTLGFFLPIILGILSTIIMYNENQYDMLKQLWIVPINKMQFFFSKLFVVMIYSVGFMLLTAIATLISANISGCTVITVESVVYLLRKCLEIGVLAAFAMLPILAIAASSKGYILPACLTLVYVFSYFIISGINMYIHPLCSMSVIICRNNEVPGMNFSQAINIPQAFICILVWSIVSILFANTVLKRR